MDKSLFWKMVKRARGPSGSKTFAIRNKIDKVVHDIPAVLEVWRAHFASLCVPKVCERFDDDHYERVSTDVNNYNLTKEVGYFLDTPFSSQEIKRVISRLYLKKACGYDDISS